MNKNQYTHDELRRIQELTHDPTTEERLERIDQQILVLQRRRAEIQASAKAAKARTLEVGSLVDYLDERGMSHTALVLEVKPKNVLKLKVFRFAKSDLIVEVGESRWRK